MARNDRPEWFKFWRRNRRQLDIEQLSMESRGIVFTNMMRYFDCGDAELIDMSPLECMAFNVVKINVDDSFSEFAGIAERNRENGKKGGRPPKNPENPVGYLESQITQANPKNQKTEGRVQSTEDRGQSTEVETDKRRRFVPPTVDEISAYCRERGNHVDPQKVFDYYSQADWKDSNGKPVRNWKQKIIAVWERQEEKQQKPDLSWRNQR